MGSPTKRILFASTRGAGHFLPLVPFAEACMRKGHEVLVCGPPSLADAVERAGYAFRQFDDPDEGELAEVWSQVPSQSPDEQNVTVIREIFARLNSSASLPGLTQACREWRPDVVLRDPAEYGSAIAAELHGIPHARAGIGLASMEELSLGIAAGTLDGLRRSVGLPSDPNADRIRESPYLTLFPATFEDPAAPVQPRSVRFRDPAWDEPVEELSGPSTESERPLVYVTFGSVAGGMEMVLPVYASALAAVADLPVRVLMTVGHEADLDSFAPAPANVRVERWVPQAQALARADAVVNHAGSGSTLGALAAGLPIVAVPLFADQPYNARRVADTGAGVAVKPDPMEIRTGVRRVLEEQSQRAGARRLAAEMRSHPPIEAAVDFLARLNPTTNDPRSSS